MGRWGGWGARMAQEHQHATDGVASGLLILFDDGIGGTADGAEALLSTSAQLPPLSPPPPLISCSAAVVEDDDTPGKLLYYHPPCELLPFRCRPCCCCHLSDADACAAVETEKVYFLLGFVLQVSPPACVLRAGRLFALTLCRRRRGCWLTCKGLRTIVLCWPLSAAWRTPKPCTAGLAPSVQGAPVA